MSERPRIEPPPRSNGEFRHSVVAGLYQAIMESSAEEHPDVEGILSDFVTVITAHNRFLWVGVTEDIDMFDQMRMAIHILGEVGPKLAYNPHFRESEPDVVSSFSQLREALSQQVPLDLYCIDIDRLSADELTSPESLFDSTGPRALQWSQSLVQT